MPRPRRTPPPIDVMRQVAKWSFEQGLKNKEIAALLHKKRLLENPRNVRYVQFALDEAGK
jgi:hypothetical protein